MLVTRALLALSCALLLGAVVVRNAMVAQFAEVRPQLATAAWSGHPEAELWSGLTDIAASTREHRPVDGAVLQRIQDAARKAPLAAAPFLVRGVQAQVAGDEATATSAFMGAEQRDGRSVPARYFLADHYLRVGDARHGLQETAMLARMIPNGVAAVAPYLATYAKDSRAWPQIRALFRSDPQLADAALSVLADDPANRTTVLALAVPSRGSAASVWAPRLIGGLTAQGRFAQAYSTWRSFGDPSPSALGAVYDAQFREPGAAPPFNWTLASSALGLAERQGGGRLHVVYYGQQDGVLASELLVLKSGRYRLTMSVTGDLPKAGSLNWSVTCAGASAPLAQVPLQAAIATSLAVPDNCPAQRLQLSGSAPEIAQTVDVTVSHLSLAPEQTRG